MSDEMTLIHLYRAEEQIIFKKGGIAMSEPEQVKREIINKFTILDYDSLKELEMMIKLEINRRSEEL